jgi:hypothetical protein
MRSRSSHPPHLIPEGRAVLDSERDRIFGDWLADHKRLSA